MRAVIVRVEGIWSRWLTRCSLGKSTLTMTIRMMPLAYSLLKDSFSETDILAIIKRSRF